MKSSDHALATALAMAFLVACLQDDSHAATRRVNAEGTGDFPTIQAALNASTRGDSVVVAPGTYSWTNQGTGDDYGLIRYWVADQDEVDLVSEGGPEVTILDAEGQGRVFFANGNNSSDNVNFVIDGFTLRNGVAPTYENRTEREGGAMALHLVYPLIRNCIFEDNNAEYGGAVWAGGVSVIDFVNCIFRRNSVSTERDVGVFGGGVFVGGTSVGKVSFIDSQFIDNVSQDRGGGLFAIAANLDATRCLFTGNSTGNADLGKGSAIYLFDTHLVRLQEILVRDNDTSNGPAVAITLDSSTDMRVSLNSSIIADNAPGAATVIVGPNMASVVSVSCTNIFGHPEGDWQGAIFPRLGQAGNVSVDPMFCEPSHDARSVHPDSPMLSDNNFCRVDIGGVTSGCSGVPVAISHFGAHWTAENVRLRLALADPALELRSLRTLRIDADGRITPIHAPWTKRDGFLELTDHQAPAEGATYRLESENGSALATTVLSPRPTSVLETRIAGTSPNPFNPRTEIAWTVARDASASLRIFDARGRLVVSLEEGPRNAGSHRTTWNGLDDDGRAVASGVYLVEVRQGESHHRQKIALVR